MTFGKRSLTIQTTGSIEENLTSGTYKTTVSAGAYTINVKAGTIDIKSNAGLVTISGSSVTIKGNIVTMIDSPLVRIGSGSPIGGVLGGLPGIPTDFDRMTGSPFKGSMKVSIA
jgi:hypothetical protein